MTGEGIFVMSKPKVAFIGRPFDGNWELDDPTGKSDNEFLIIIKEIESKILQLKKELEN